MSECSNATVKKENIREERTVLHDNNDCAISAESILNLQHASPENVEALNSLGVIYARRGDYPNAESLFRKAIEFDPQNGIAYYNLGLVHSRQSRNIEAVEDFHRALEINPEDFAAHNDLGVIYHSQGEYELARTHFIRALEANVLYKKALMNLFDICLDAESYSTGLAWVQKYLNALFGAGRENQNHAD